MKTKLISIPIRLILMALGGLLSFVSAVHAQLAGDDNFLGNVDPEKWTCNPIVDGITCPESTPEDERDIIIGNGQLFQNVGRAIYLTGDPPGVPEPEDALIRIWRPNVAPANQSFSVKINVNMALDLITRYPDQGDHHYAGLGIFKTSTIDRSASGFAKVPDRIVFAIRRENSGGINNFMRLFGHEGNGPEFVASNIEIGATRARFDIIIDYDASSQTFTARFQEFLTPPGPLEEGGSISLGAGGHLDWGLTNEDTFTIGMIPAAIGEVFIDGEDQRTFYDNFEGETTGEPIDIGGGPQNQTISFAQLGNTTYGLDRIFLSGTASSGLPVTFALVSGPGLINPDNSLSTTGPGTVTVRASQAGNAAFNAAPDVDRSFTVTQPSTGASSLLDAGSAKLVNDGTFFDGNTYNGFELAGDHGTFSSIAGEITRISFLDRDGDLMFAEFGSDDPNTVLIITFEEFMSASAASPYIQSTTVYAQGHPSFEIQNSTPLTFVSFFSLGNDVLRVDGSLIKSDTFDDDVNGVAEIQSLTISDGSTAIGGINSANANFIGSAGVIGVDAPDVSVGVFLFVGDITPSATAMPMLRISPDSAISEILINGGDLAEAIGNLQIDTNAVVYSFPIMATGGQRSISDSPLRTDLGDGSLPPVTNTFVANPDDFFVTDGQTVIGP